MPYTAGERSRPLAKRLYSIGQFANLACVSLRTLRYYDAAGLLSPSQYTEAGYRLYSEADLIRLQQILGLKLLGFSLDDIKRCLNHEPRELPILLARQKAMLRDKRRELEAALKAIEQAEARLQGGEDDWEILAGVIETMQMEQQTEWVKKYFSDAQLQKMEDLSETAYSPEARAKLQERQSAWTEADQERANEQWAHVASESKRLAEAGADPGGDEGQALARLKSELLFGFTQGDPEVEAGLKRFWDSHSALPEAEQPLASVVPTMTDTSSQFLDRAHALYNERRNKPTDAL